jgi:CDP-diacylglycerol--glycerol-3-phosphate 3-phosphatidyltransferase
MRTLIHVITLSRIFLALSIIFLRSELYLLSISIWSIFADFLDGYLARRLQLTSLFGERLDQIADKIFHLATLICLLHLQLSPSYFVILFVLREILMLILRYLGLSTSSSLMLGKWKTATTYCYIIYLFGIFFLFRQNPFIFFSRILEIIILVMSYLSLFLSIKPRFSEK